GDAAFLHGFEQGRLTLGRGAVDLVDEQQLAKDRAPRQSELTGLEVEQVRAANIARQQVGSELDATEFQPGGCGEALREKRLGCARRTFEQHVTLRKKRGQQVLDSFPLSDDRLADLGADCLSKLAGVLESLVHAARVLSIVLRAAAARSSSVGRRAR